MYLESHAPEEPMRKCESCMAEMGLTPCREGGQQAAGGFQLVPVVLRCGAAVLQDLAVAVADAAADAYLAEAGVSRDGGCHSETALAWWGFHPQCTCAVVSGLASAPQHILLPHVGVLQTL